MKYYIGFNGVGHGHGARCRALSQELQHRGHEVVFTTYNGVYAPEEQRESSFSKLLKQEGYVVHDGITEMYGMIRNGMLDTHLTFIDARNKFLRVLTKGTKEQLEILKKEEPDVVVSDGHLSSVIAAKIKNIPYFVILNLNNLDGLVVDYLMPFAKAILSAPQQLATKILIPDFKPPDTICQGNIQSYGKKVDSKIVYTGPILRDEVYEQATHHYKSDTVYVCMGGQNRVSLEQHLQRAQRKLHLDFLVVNSSPREFENGVRHMAYIQNPLPYIKGAVAIITHGGHSTLMEALFCGKPVIGITQERQERYHNIMGLQDRRLGRLVMLERGGYIDEENLFNAIKNVTSDGYLQSAQEFSTKARKHNGTKTAVDILTSTI